ncbi:Hypothetical_protein [Hexamita inflata]|uniref:Hypothetical_protein n=1 Tax=Hexamita inflata TaxID=28002 RepID=A0AA86PAD7_9EUKA|nr:Hypothetical protein HINF_LOCUS22692 [Hexamita inflata]
MNDDIFRETLIPFMFDSEVSVHTIKLSQKTRFNNPLHFSIVINAQQVQITSIQKIIKNNNCHKHYWKMFQQCLFTVCRFIDFHRLEYILTRSHSVSKSMKISVIQLQIPLNQMTQVMVKHTNCILHKEVE